MDEFFARNRLSAYLDGELTAAETAEVELALERSASLRAELDAMRSAVDLVRRAGPLRAPPGLLAKVQRQVAKEPLDVGWRRWVPRVRVEVAMVAMAAAVVLVVVGRGEMDEGGAPAETEAAPAEKARSKDDMLARKEEGVQEQRPDTPQQAVAPPLQVLGDDAGPALDVGAAPTLGKTQSMAELKSDGVLGNEVAKNGIDDPGLLGGRSRSSGAYFEEGASSGYGVGKGVGFPPDEAAAAASSAGKVDAAEKGRLASQKKKATLQKQAVEKEAYAPDWEQGGTGPSTVYTPGSAVYAQAPVQYRLQTTSAAGLKELAEIAASLGGQLVDGNGRPLATYPLEPGESRVVQMLVPAYNASAVGRKLAGVGEVTVLVQEGDRTLYGEKATVPVRIEVDAVEAPAAQ